MENRISQLRNTYLISNNRGYCLCSLSIRKLAMFTVVLPFIGLFICFITAYIFQYDDVHETHCKVYNVIPSISAITGITPQNYLWRLFVALHIGPRILVANIYYNYFCCLNKVGSASGRNYIHILACYWLNITELTALCGVTYISNRENYPMHEKLFVTFMVCSLMYMTAMTSLYKKMHNGMSSNQNASFQLKRFLLATSIFSTASLIFFFLKHRFYCHDLAFTWFAFSEYIIAACNMGFHLTVMMDFPSEKLLVTTSSLPSRDNKID